MLFARVILLVAFILAVFVVHFLAVLVSHFLAVFVGRLQGFLLFCRPSSLDFFRRFFHCSNSLSFCSFNFVFLAHVFQSFIKPLTVGDACPLTMKAVNSCQGEDS